MPRLVILALALLASACSTPHQLAKCTGPLEILNPGQWQPTPTELAAIDKLCPEDK